MKRWLLGAAAALLALAAHVAYAYLPRARPAGPKPDSRVAALLADPGFPAAVWVPYPHQNLAYLRRLAGFGPESLRAVARLAGLPSPALPTFGPLALPPSSEIAVASDETGERWAVLARVYPGFAAFAKLAGSLADNPWLRGGEVMVEGRRAVVRWRGSLWTVASDGVLPQSDATTDAEGTGLAWLRVRQAVDPLPAGLYRLWEDESGLAVAAGGGERRAAPSASLAGRLEPLGLFLLVFSGGHEALAEPVQALAFFAQREARIRELPRIVSIHEPGTERWLLPGEGLLEIAGREPRTALDAGWALAALDATSLEEAHRLVPELDALSRGDLEWGLWLDLRGGLAEVDRIARTLAGVPIAPRRQVERWNDARTVLAPLADRYARLSVTVTDEPRVFALRLEAR